MAAYADPLLRLADDELVIRRYYFPLGDRRIRLAELREVREYRLGTISGRLRIWGSGDLRHWFNLDSRRPRKKRAFALDLGRLVTPVVTPDDPERFAQALVAAGVRLRAADETP
jgi:hypothetical protein